MTRRDDLAEQFEGHRPHLRAVAYRMLGTMSEADDAVQRRGSGSIEPTPVATATCEAG